MSLYSGIRLHLRLRKEAKRDVFFDFPDQFIQGNTQGRTRLAVNNLNTYLRFIRLQQKRIRPRLAESRQLGMEAKREAETLAEELPGQFPLPPEAMNNPRDGRMKAFFLADNFLPSLYTVDDKRLPVFLGQQSLLVEYLLLLEKRDRGMEFVQTGLAYRHDIIKGIQATFEFLQLGICILNMPRMDAAGKFFILREYLIYANDTIDNLPTIFYRRQETVSMDIVKMNHQYILVLGNWVISAPAPRVATEETADS